MEGEGEDPVGEELGVAPVADLAGLAPGHGVLPGRNGVVAKGGEELKGFAIAGEDKKFVWADAKIVGENVVVSSDEVPEPVAVRYAWDTNPVCNLFNEVGLPASPFRTDDWPGVTDDKR